MSAPLPKIMFMTSALASFTVLMMSKAARLVFIKPLHRESDVCYTCVHPLVGEPRDVAIVVMDLTIVVMSICDARKMRNLFSTAIIVPFDRLFSTATIISLLCKL